MTAPTTVDALDALRAACPSARPAEDADAVAGAPARYVVRPGSTEELSAALRVATEHDLAVTARGAGTKQAWYAPPRRLDLVVDTTGLTGVVEHVAGDLIVVARAGTPLAELQEALAPHGQQLALDEPLPGSTVGGTIAASTSGPRRMLYGTVRDLLIGVTIVLPDGTVAKAGGKVVKNVAGYDLGKLVAGSFGTLGIVTQAAFRLHPLPGATAVVRRRVDSVEEAGRIAAAAIGAQVVPSGVDVDAPADGALEVAVMLEGVPDGVAGRVATTLGLLGEGATSDDEPPGWWTALPFGPGDTGVKLTCAISQVPAVLAAVRTARERHGTPVAARGSAGTGVLHAVVPQGTAAGTVAAVVRDLRSTAEAGGGHAVVVQAPDEVRGDLDAWGTVPGLHLMHRIKDQFDPGARLAPGRFVGGI